MHWHYWQQRLPCKDWWQVGGKCQATCKAYLHGSRHWGQWGWHCQWWLHVGWSLWVRWRWDQWHCWCWQRASLQRQGPDVRTLMTLGKLWACKMLRNSKVSCQLSGYNWSKYTPFWIHMTQKAYEENKQARWAWQLQYITFSFVPEWGWLFAQAGWWALWVRSSIKM